MELSESLENYLEAIFHISARKGAARAKDIAMALAVNNSSVTEALRSLSKKGLVNYAPYDLITLTDAGKVVALVVVNRHEVLHQFLAETLGLNEADSDSIACKMEHVVTDELIDRLQELINYVGKECSTWNKSPQG